MSVLILSASDVQEVSSKLTLAELTNLMAGVFAHITRPSGNIEMLHRSSITGAPKRDTLFMPSRIEGTGTGIKVVSVPKGNTGGGLSATTLVLDEETGVVKAVVNARTLTALRTAAGSALATHLLGQIGPRVLVAFGAGEQIKSHVCTLLGMYPTIKTCTIVNRSKNKRLDSLHALLQGRFPHVHVVAECIVDGLSEHSSPGGFILSQAVASADIICTATPSTKALFRAAWVKAGTHINLIGSYTRHMVEVEEELIHRAALVAVDSRDACSTEAGDLLNAGMKPEEMVEIGQIIESDGGFPKSAGLVEKVKRAGGITIFKSVGVGPQDVAIAGLIVSRAESLGIGTRIVHYDCLPE